MPLSHKMKFLENVFKSFSMLSQNFKFKHLNTFSLVCCDINAPILEIQHEECLTSLFKISLEFANVFTISLCKPLVTTIKS